MTSLNRLGARLRARLIPDLRRSARLWSVRLAFLGALLATLAAAAPDALLAAWNAMPDEVRVLVPPHIARWVSAALFAATIVARVLKQGEPRDDA